MEITGKKLFSELELIKTPDFIILFKCIDTKLNKKKFYETCITSVMAASTRKSMSSKKRLIL
jgi:hypothetical protein